MKYQPDPPPLNADPVLGNYLHRELQKLSGLFQADRINNLNISTYIEGLLDDIDAAAAQGTLDVPSNATLASAIANYLPLAGGTLTGGLLGTTLGLSGLLSANGGQIKFPSTQNPSADANTLDDFKLGTFTPNYALTTPGTSVFTPSAIRYGRYFKIGSWVFATGRAITDAVSIGTGTGSAKIETGIPYPAKTVSPAYHGGVNLQYQNSWTTQAPRGGYMTGSDINLVYYLTAASLAAITGAHFTNAASCNDCIFNLMYETDN